MKTKTAKEYWKEKFDEYPQNDAEKLAVTMMQEYYIYANQDKWISVETELPDKQGCYLVISKNSFPKNSDVMVAEFYSDNKTFYSESSDARIGDVTHWQPLPTPPTEKNKV